MPGFGAARLGKAVRGLAVLGAARQGRDTASMVSNPCSLIDKVWYGKVWLGKARWGEVRRGRGITELISQGMVRLVLARLDRIRRGLVGHDEARLVVARHG